MPPKVDFEFDVFLSHNKADKPRVHRLAKRLTRAGLRVWFDEWVIQAGDQIYLAVERGLEASRTLVLCLSPAALGSDWVALERTTALFRDPTNANRRFIPVLLADCELPDTLRGYKYVDYRDGSRAAFVRLLKACRPWAELPPSTTLSDCFSLPGDRLQMCAWFPDESLCVDNIQCSYRLVSRQIPDELKALRESRGMPKLQELREEGRIADNNPRYSLYSMSVRRPHTPTGRAPFPVLKFEPCDFLDYLSMNYDLDEEVLETSDGKKVSIREKYGLHFRLFDWPDIERLPIHCPFGTVAGVVTADNQLAIPLRSKMCAIERKGIHVEAHHASLSCAEGMLYPADSFDTDGRVPSPFKTALRALKDELGLLADQHYDEHDLRLLAIGFDKLLAQPLGVFFLKLRSVRFRELYKLWGFSQGPTENKALIAVPATESSFGTLFRKMFLCEGKPVVLFSNQQEFGFCVIARYLEIAGGIR